MDLIKENKQKKRAVFKDGETYKKVWYIKDVNWIETHVSLLKQFVPGYVKQYGWTEDTMWLTMNPIAGIPASKFEHTPEFIRKVYAFCLENIRETKPYAHGDWVLSNIIVNGDTMQMCDWDNFNIWPANDIKTKLHSDLRSAFGDKFNDATGI